MSTDHNTLAGLENQAFSHMARLHVVLRRQTGRVTDIEYMRIDPVYCRHVLNLAQDLKNDDLMQLCGKLQEIYFGPDGLFVRTPPKQPLMNRLGAADARTVAAPVSGESADAESEDAIERHHKELNEAVDKGYIGRLR